MEITLEKIELVVDRTGVTYAEAKKALEESDGSVVDAIILIQEKMPKTGPKKSMEEKGEELLHELMELVKKGNVARIIIRRGEETIINVPLNAGIIGLCVAPVASVVAVAAAMGFNCSVEVVKTDGETIMVSEAVSDAVNKAADFGEQKYREFTEKHQK